jgi:hypothetical protein
MDPREVHEILAQGAVRPETPEDRRQRDGLEADLLDSPLRGRPLQTRLRNFQRGPDSVIGALGGPLPWMRRLREIELRTAAHESRLAERWRELAAEADDAAAFERLWLDEANAWSFADVNELIDRHNRWYPIEARLPMDPKTRDFVLIDGRPYARTPLGANWILERFPAELERAAA